MLRVMQSGEIFAKEYLDYSVSDSQGPLEVVARGTFLPLLVQYIDFAPRQHHTGELRVFDGGISFFQDQFAPPMLLIPPLALDKP